MIPGQVMVWIESSGYGNITSFHAVGGGCINNGTRLLTSKGPSLFLKTNTSAPADMFEREAEGLRALDAGDGPRVPRPILWDQDFILLEDMAPSSPHSSYWSDFGHKLASLHLHTHDQFGFTNDNYIGSTPQPNPFTSDGYVFFAEHRLLYQAQMARRRNLLGKSELMQIERIAQRLPDLVPPQPASLSHGDLWSGNAIADLNGDPAIIDPAAHFGWAEAELAMTNLFGSFPVEFYQAYQEVRALTPGYQARYSLYNLYHLLNHLNLFGAGYLGHVQRILREYR